ncbi:MAG: hypothetical protein B6U97_02350 [Candidatus Altiarchaeales archaeon ex4484_96]|nr:MAG: hypothetical protein B6U97_02350 [Candidatus Altiarchaeales archaeon ex4484_96]
MADSIKKLVCIICPNSCELTVYLDEGEITKVKGNLCPKGVDYVREELYSPMRTVTSTVELKGGVLPLASVKTSKPIPKEKIMDVMDLLADVMVWAPVEVGQLIVENAGESGANIISTKKINKKRKH